MPIDLDYTLYMPMFGEHEDNRLMGGVSANASLSETPPYFDTEIWQVHDFTVGGATSPPVSAASTTVSEHLGRRSNGPCAPDGQTQLLLRPGDAVTFGVEPGLWCLRLGRWV